MYRIGITALHVRPGRSGSHQPYLVNLVGALSRLKTPHEFILFVNPANQHLFENARDRMEFVVYPRITEKVFPRILFEQLVLPFDACRRKINLMHYAGTTSSILVNRYDVVTVHHDSKTQHASMSGLRNIYFDTVLKFNKRAGKIIAPSKVYAEELVEYFGYRSDQVSPIHHGVNPIFRNVSNEETVRARKEYGIESNAILTVTNTLPHKNIPNLLRAYFLLITKYHLENQLVIVGSVDEAVLTKTISEIDGKSEHVRTRIKVIPFLPHEKLPPIYSSANVFVFFSKVETFGLPLVEAMACGLPVVASDIPIHREILQNAGLLISPDAPDELAEALYKIISDVEYKNILRQSAADRSQNFSWEKSAMETLQVYEDAWSLVRRN